jgi:SpoIID/LytB domain protein
MRRRSLAVLAAALAGQLAVGAVAAAPRVEPRLRPAAAATASITLVGHGNGHGIGLSQWGAYGDAVDLGWDAWRIVDHYFGGTQHGVAPLDATVSVRLQGLDGAQTAVVSDADLLGVGGAGLHAIVARPVPGGYSVWGRATPACPSATDPLADWTPLGTVTGAVTLSTTASADPAASPAQLVATCRPDGTLRAYRGVIQAVTGSGGEIRTVNVVPVEQYLRAVVAKEMSPSWANAGGGRGLQALEAQVIAGRSYALSERLYSYAMTCDSVCQTYQGAATRSSLGAPFVAVEHRLSDPAVQATAGMVLRNGDGSYVHAMYAASSGGYTALNPVLRFPAVPDDGDATAGNPYHTWTQQLSGAAIEAAYPAIGSFIGTTITGRNGLGDLGGRVTTMTVDGTARSLTVTGDQFRAAMGLKSNWFALAGAPPTRASTITSSATALARATRIRG